MVRRGSRSWTPLEAAGRYFLTARGRAKLAEHRLETCEGTSGKSEGSKGPITCADKPDLTKEDLAMVALRNHGDEWTLQQIARYAGCHRSTLYRMPRFNALRMNLGMTVPAGKKSKEGDIEAEDSDHP